ncbi:MAG: GNAT family N-acetyltransferase [Sarcina sp.]
MGFKNEEYKRTGNLVYIKKPNFEELEYTKKLWSDYDTMKEIGGVYDFTENHKRSFYKKMINPTDGKNFYCLVYKNDGTKVGEVSFHGYDSATKIARLNVKIEYRHRGKGYGTEAIKLLLEFYFYEFLGEVIMETPKNKIGENTLKKLGFKEATQNTYRLKKSEFLQEKTISALEIGVIAFNGFSLSRLGIITEYFNECKKKKIADINIDLIGGHDTILSNTGVKIQTDAIISTRKKYDLLVLLDGINIIKEGESIRRTLKSLINYANVVAVMDSSISVLIELDYLKGMNIILNEEQKNYYRQDLWRYNILNEDYIDNGKFILMKGINGIIDGGLHLVEKLYGKNNIEKIIQYI